MGLLTFAVLLETRAGPCDEACYQDHRGCNEILCAFTLVKRDVYTQISQVHFILSSWVSFCGRWLGLFKWDLIAAWEMALCFQLRRENVARQENLILNHKELFCVNSLLGQKAAWSFLIPAAILSWKPLPLSPFLRAAGEPCCWATMCSGSVCPGVCSEPPAFLSYPHNGNFSNYVGNGIGTSCSAPLPLKSLRLACPSGHP